MKLLDDFNRLEYVQAINPYFLKVFEPFHMLDNLKRTVEDDEIFQDYSEYNKLYANLRKVHLSIKYIHNTLDVKATLAQQNNPGRNMEGKPLIKVIQSLEIYENLLDSISETLVKLDNNLPELEPNDYILAKSILFILRKELLAVHDLIYTGRRC